MSVAPQSNRSADVPATGAIAAKVSVWQPQPKCHYGTVRHASRIDARPVDRDFVFDGADHGGEEADVVGVAVLWLAAATPAIPGAHEAVGVGDQEVPGVGFGVPVVSRSACAPVPKPPCSITTSGAPSPTPCGR